MKKLLDLQLSIPTIDELTSRKLMGGNGYAPPPEPDGDGYLPLPEPEYDYEVNIPEIEIIGEDPGVPNAPETEYEIPDPDMDPIEEKDRTEPEQPDSDDDQDQDRPGENEDPNGDNNQGNTDNEGGSGGYDNQNDVPNPPVPNGDCVRGAIEAAIRNAGGEVDSKAIESALEEKAGQKGENGYSLNSETFRDVVDDFLKVHSPEGQNDLKEEIENGKNAIARIDADGDGDWEHAVVLTDSDDDGFWYYDPVLGCEEYIDNENVHDPLIIDGVE